MLERRGGVCCWLGPTAEALESFFNFPSSSFLLPLFPRHMITPIKQLLHVLEARRMCCWPDHTNSSQDRSWSCLGQHQSNPSIASLSAGPPVLRNSIETLMLVCYTIVELFEDTCLANIMEGLGAHNRRQCSV